SSKVTRPTTRGLVGNEPTRAASSPHRGEYRIPPSRSSSYPRGSLGWSERSSTTTPSGLLISLAYAISADLPRHRCHEVDIIGGRCHSCGAATKAPHP